MIVADASVVLDALMGAPPARAAVEGRQLFAPHLVDPEVISAVRRGVAVDRLAAEDAVELLSELRRLGITRYPVYGLTARIWELRDNLTPYDASYVAVAEALECPLVTADARIAGAAGVRCPVMVVRR